MANEEHVEILKQAIPGCEEMEAQSDTEFTATLSTKLGPLKARFKGQVRLSEVLAPESYTLTGEGRGGPAFPSGNATQPGI